MPKNCIRSVVEMEMIKSTQGWYSQPHPDHGLTGICISCTSHSEASHVRAGHSSDSLCMVFKCCCKLQHQGEQHSPVVLPLYHSFLRPKAKKCEYSTECVSNRTTRAHFVHAVVCIRQKESTRIYQVIFLKSVHGWNVWSGFFSNVLLVLLTFI